MVEKTSGEKVIERSGPCSFDNEGPVFTSKEGLNTVSTRYAWLYFYFEDEDVGKLGTPTVAVEGADIYTFEHDDTGFAIAIDGDKFREMSTINVSYEVPDSLGNVTTGSISCQKYQWERYPVLGGPNYCSANYESSSHTFYAEVNLQTYGSLEMVGGGKYMQFVAEGRVSMLYRGATNIVGKFVKESDGNVYRISKMTSDGSYTHYYADRVYKNEPERIDYDNPIIGVIDINETTYPANGKLGSTWYIKK